MPNWAASAAAAMLTIMVLLRSNRKLPAFPRRADRSSDHDRGAVVASMQYIKTRPDYPMNAFRVRVSSIGSQIPATASTGYHLLGEPMFSIAALSHFEV